MAIVTVALACLFWNFERGKTSAKELAFIAVLATVAAVGRVPFTILPNVEPTTFIVMDV